MTMGLSGGLPNQRQEMSGNVRKRQKLNFSIFHDVFVIIMNNSENSIRFFHFSSLNQAHLESD